MLSLVVVYKELQRKVASFIVKPRTSLVRSAWLIQKETENKMPCSLKTEMNPVNIKLTLYILWISIEVLRSQQCAAGLQPASQLYASRPTASWICQNSLDLAAMKWHSGSHNKASRLCDCIPWAKEHEVYDPKKLRGAAALNLTGKRIMYRRGDIPYS